MQIRKPIISVLGHVDHGKTSILDYIRGTCVVEKEAGRITQHIGATEIPLEIIQKKCGTLLKSMNMNFTIPGVLFIDTPGHAAFTNLRKRGGNLADIAILVVDINEGVKPQTIEAIEILKQYKTPFVVAVNKIDLLAGWHSKPEINLINDIKQQSELVQTELDNKLYTLLARFYDLGFQVERFDRVDDYTKTIAMVPCSAKTGEGLPELIMVLIGLAQRYLEKSLKIEVKGPAKGTILEIKEEKGVGRVLDTIIYDGSLKQGDTIVIGSLNKPIVTKVKSILMGKNTCVKEVHAAAGIRISAPDLDEAIAGMPLRVANKDIEKIQEEIQNEVEEVLIETDNEGVIVKADTLGSLEAIIKLLKEKNINIKRASIGDVSKKDISEAKTEVDETKKAILAFNVKSIDTSEVKIISHNVIYQILDDYEAWKLQVEGKLKEKELEKLTRPCKLRFMPNYIFRQSHPAVIGVEVMGGIVKAGIPLIKANNNKIGELKSMQLEGKNVEDAKKGNEIAISLPDVTVGRQIQEGDIFYSDLSEEEFMKLKELKKHLGLDEIEVLKEIAEIKRKENPVWGI